ncbi:MAG: phosphate acyltransferase PlsX [Verrucomicrobia bacterium GWF2_51_19]|nr:MAG: phosphate acyltransferase PlsX [Verrucomicrobia bacterium GWF2_51_19]HCJ12327.1 phosphate acyltransferase PlsX [Opitutae bacterium]
MSEPAGILAIDAMGSDLGPSEVVHGLALALKKKPALDGILLVGQEPLLLSLLEAEKVKDNGRVRIVHASEVIDMDDRPLQAIKQKKDASMLRAIDLVKTGQAKGVLSCGNTGSLMAAGTLRLRPIEGFERPALAAIVPTENGFFILLDVGANPNTTPKQMVHNALLGKYYAQAVLGIEDPAIGLLTIGTEEGKGNELSNKSHEYLKAARGHINYHGLIEGFHVFDRTVDVVICDGFVGNILLKTCESLLINVKHYLTHQLKKNWMRRMGALLCLRAFREMKQQFNPDRYGGVPLLGLQGTIIKAHGSSNATAIQNAIDVGYNMIREHKTSALQDAVAKVNAGIEEL